jgi:hypothetical protein
LSLSPCLIKKGREEESSALSWMKLGRLRRLRLDKDREKERLRRGMAILYISLQKQAKGRGRKSFPVLKIMESL